MKSLNYLLLFTILLAFFAVSPRTYAQAEPVMYFCEKYDSDLGEVGISDRFTKGYITVMVKCDTPLRLRDVSIQYDKYNFSTGEFEYYKKFNFTIERDMKYVFFSRNDDSDMEFNDTGFYRVFLLDSNDKTIASALVEIID
jgi:hypothetical protein